MSILTPVGANISVRKAIDAKVSGQSEDNLREVLGNISTTTGAILSGVGFTSVLSSPGVIVVTWTKAFTRVPTIHVSLDFTGGSTARVILFRDPTITSVVIVTLDLAGNLNGAIAHVRAEAPW